MTSPQGLNPEIQRAGSSRGTCKGLVGRVLPWQQQELQVFPPSRCERAAHPPFMQIPRCISLLAKAHLHLLLFWLQIDAFGLQEHSPRWIFPLRKEPQVKDHFIWSKRGAWEIYFKLNKLFHVSWTQARYKVIWNPGRKPPTVNSSQSLELK